MGKPMTSVFTHTSGAIVGARQRVTELAMERVLDKRYKIVAPIGAGGSSQVYLAQDTKLNREVAVKVLDPAAAADTTLRRLFVKEARALGQLSHPGIVAVYDVGEVDGSPYIVMEHLAGGSLRQRIERNGPLLPAEASRVAIEVAEGLAFAHARGIIHADLKPSNILFDASDHAKICDFGIARAPQEDADTPQLFATAMYVAPERVEGKPASVASDIYGLGLVLYEMLIGKPPFVSANASVLLRDHVVRQPVPPSHLRPSLPRELDTVVLRALAKQPKLRYQKASDFARALTSIANLDSELGTTRFVGVMAEPIKDFVPHVEQSPVVALLSTHGQPIRRAFFAVFAALPLLAMSLLAGLGMGPSLVVSSLVAVVAFAGQLGFAIALAWLVETVLLFLFVPSLAVLFALMGLWIWVRDVPAEHTALAMAMPAAAPFGLGPALILTSAAVHGLMGVVTTAWGALLTVIFAIAMGRQSLGPFVQTGFSLEQESVFDPVRAAQTKGAILGLLQAPGNFGPLGVLLDPATLWSQLVGFISRLVGADVASIATVLAWTVAALAVWAVTRVLRIFFDTLLRRPKRWFALYVLAQAAGSVSGASVLLLLFIIWGPLERAPGRPADGVLLVAAMVGALLATAAGIVIGATQPAEPDIETSPPVSARRMPVR